MQFDNAWRELEPDLHARIVDGPLTPGNKRFMDDEETAALLISA